MVNSALRTDDSLPSALAARARAASDGRLAIDTGAGIFAAIGVALWRPPGWLMLLSVAICFAAFGTWGIADRELGERARAGSPLVKLLAAWRVVAALVGALAVLVLIFSLLALALGTIIS